MREVSGPVMDRLPATAHLLQPVIDRAVRDPGRPVAAYRDGDRFVDVTASDLYDRIRRLAKGLIACGVQEGDRVALMAHTRLEWLLVDYAILAAGGVTVPVYETSSAEQLRMDRQRQWGRRHRRRDTRDGRVVRRHRRRRDRTAHCS